MGNDSQQMVPANGGGTNIARTGFGETSVETKRETAATAVAAQAQAEVQARYIVAMQHPRDDDNVRIRLLKECSRPGFAQRAFFSVQRGSKPGRLTGTPNRIEGLSVRFAEAAIRHMGNAMASTRSVYDDAEKRIVNVTVVDLETNSVHSKDIVVGKTVERRKLGQGQLALKTRTNTFGDTVYIVESTDDELLQKENALVSKTLRTEALRLLPADTLEECEQRIVATVKNEDAKDPDAARKALADGFASLNILPSDIKSYLGHDLAQCSPAQLTDLRGMFAAIREGETTWHEILAAKTEASATPSNEPGASAVQPANDGDKPKGRGSRLASQVRKDAGAPAAAATPAASTTPAATPTTPAATSPATPVTRVDPPQPQIQSTPPKGGGQQPSMFSGQPTGPLQEPVIPPAVIPQSIEDERKAWLAEQARMCSEWPGKVGIPVTVTLANGQTSESYTTSMSRMFGDMAVVNVEGFASPLALTQLRRLD
jgi:hypothetical protein